MVFLRLYSLLLFIFSLICFSNSSPLPFLVSLNCTPPSKNASFYNKSIHVLVDRLTSQVTKTGIITSTINLGPERLTGIMQCRFNLSPVTCTLCAKNIAKETVFIQCPNAISVTAWLDGCYLRYCYYQHNYASFSPHACSDNTTINWSCSNQTKVKERVDQFEAALETLLLRLKADIKMVTHLRFATGKVRYGNYNEVYGLAECVQNVSPKDCEVCVGKGIEKLSEYCGGKEGGTVVAEYCIVRYESYKFFSNVNAGGWLNNESGAYRIWENNQNNGGSKGFKVKLAAVWGVAVACFVVVVFSAWLLRRSIINKAKVATFGSADQMMLEIGSD